MFALLEEPGLELRRLYGAELWCAGFAVRAVTIWDEALAAVRDLLTPAVIVVVASIELGRALRFIGEVRAQARLRDVPIIPIAFARGSESGIRVAEVQCCLRLLPTPSDVPKAVRRADADYGSPARDDEAIAPATFLPAYCVPCTSEQLGG
jgi:hypothetical protein